MSPLRNRPFRTPHHSITGAGLVGGGRPVMPGEATLAHKGVLFLDDIGKFAPSTLQLLRQPLEAKQITIVRADSTYTFPSDFLLLAASDPCPCGHFGDPGKVCTCNETMIAAFQHKLCGPLRDKIDIRIDIPDGNSLKSAQASSISSARLQEGVLMGQDFRQWRIEQEDDDSSPQSVIASCKLSTPDQTAFKNLCASRNASGAAIIRSLKIARTIADIEQRETVNLDHLAEALALTFC